MASQKILQICPAPSDMRVKVYTDGSNFVLEQVVCLALVEEDGASRRVIPLTLQDQEIRIQEITSPAQISTETGAQPAEDEPVFVVTP